MVTDMQRAAPLHVTGARAYVSDDRLKLDVDVKRYFAVLPGENVDSPTRKRQRTDA